ncbi:MAG: hypothetical protein H6855_02455 [Rhodospirillales bacterium]|nr:hypothetical protein [Rhodospirillales bacterium]MCB9964928.1 hypothetical protein [Rhodospirillales bacterium]MCB9973722.1 hypothetical protein [Rhodospirillales bacterium]
MSVNILSNGVDFLAAARNNFPNYGIGLSARSRELTSEFLNNATTLFNTLYYQTEDAELNLSKQILALRSKLNVDREDVVLKSQTRGNTVDEEA